MGCNLSVDGIQHNKDNKANTQIFKTIKCVFCDYPAASQALWDKHITSNKHLERTEMYCAKESCDVCGCKISLLANWVDAVIGS